LKAIGIPLVRRLAVSRMVSGDQRYSVKLDRGSVKAVAAHVALAVVAAWADINRMSPDIIDEFIGIFGDAAATWASSIAREDFAATDVDQATADHWIEKTAGAARKVTTDALQFVARDTAVAA